MVRCKFECITKTERKGWGDTAKVYEYEFMAVTSGSDENKAFFAATPSGSLKVGCVRDDQFEIGKQYYLDISLA